MYDCVIIGGGPCGVACAIYLKQAGYNVAIVEEMLIGGQPLETENITNVVGFIGNGQDFGNILQKQIEDNDVKIIYGEATINDNEVYVNNSLIESKSIVIATGAIPNKLDGIKKPYYCALCDGPLFKDKNVVLIGSGNSAYSEALQLSKIANFVWFMQNTNYPNLANNDLKQQVNLIENIKCMPYNNLIEDTGEYLTFNCDQGILYLAYDAVFVAIGRTPNLKCFDNREIFINENYNIIIDNQVNKKIFAGGDVLNKDIKQISTAINDGVVISQNVIKYLREV